MATHTHTPHTPQPGTRGLISAGPLVTPTNHEIDVGGPCNTDPQCSRARVYAGASTTTASSLGGVFVKSHETDGWRSSGCDCCIMNTQALRDLLVVLSLLSVS